MIDVILVPDDGEAAGAALAQWDTPHSASHGRRRSLVGLALLRGMVANRTSTKSTDWEICVAPSGKPYAARPETNEILATVSLSHSAGWVVAAVGSAGALGIDLEAHRPRRNYAGIAAQAFGPFEQARVAAGGLTAFYRIWTLREALAKAVGCGLAMVADGRDRVESGPVEGKWTVCLDGVEWKLSHCQPMPGFSFALATDTHGECAGVVRLLRRANDLPWLAALPQISSDPSVAATNKRDKWPCSD